MRNTAHLGGALLTGLLCEPGTVSLAQDATPAEPAAFSWAAEADTVSRYVWRGLAFSEGWVAQPSLSLSAHDFTLCWWNNCDLGETPTSERWNETDLTFGYERTLARLTLEASVQSYLYPSSTVCPNTAEIGIKAGYAMGPITVWTRHWFDLAAYPGSYFGEAGLDWEHELLPHLSLQACVSMGWGSNRFNEAYAGWSEAALNAWGVEIALTWQFARHWALRPHLNSSGLLDEALRGQVEEPGLLWGGMAVNFEW